MCSVFNSFYYIVAFELLILLPELGKLCRRKIASLAEPAPRANESGTFTGYRRTGHGRNGIKPILFLAARNSKTCLQEFYEKLIAKGKKKMVALTALIAKEVRDATPSYLIVMRVP
jgi:hypothetical protein